MHDFPLNPNFWGNESDWFYIFSEIIKEEPNVSSKTIDVARGRYRFLYNHERIIDMAIEEARIERAPSKVKLAVITKLATAISRVAKAKRAPFQFTLF
jgi:hypothetical protein